MSSDKFELVATARDNATATLKKLNANITAMGSKGRGPLGGLLSGIGAISPVSLIAAVGVGALTAALADGISGALAEDKQMARLSATLRANVKDWNGSTAAIDAATTAAMDLSFSDDDARESMIKLITGTRDVTASLKDMRLAMDISRGAGVDLATATEIVLKASVGNTRALKAYGIEVRAGATATEILTILQQRFAGQAEAYANTTAGKFESAQIKVDDTMEGFGHSLITTTGGLLSYDAAIKGNTQSMADWLHAAGVFLPLLSGVGDMFQYVTDQAAVMTNHIASEARDRLGPIVPALVGGINEGMTQAQMYDAEHVARGIVNQYMPGFEAAGQELGNALATNLADSLRGSNKLVKGAMHDIMWALNHPQALEHKLQRIQKALDSPGLAKLLSGNPMQQAIGQQIQLQLTGQFESLTATTYTGGVNQIVAAINGLRGYLHSPANPYNAPGVFHQLPEFAKGGYLGGGRVGLVGENGPEYIRAGRQGNTISPASSGPTNVYVDGRVLFQIMDERMGRSMSRTPAGVVNRG